MHTENSRGGRRKRGGWGSRLSPGPPHPMSMWHSVAPGQSYPQVIHNLMQVAILTALNP
jgi:hypothetical protein